MPLDFSLTSNQRGKVEKTIPSFLAHKRYSINAVSDVLLKFFVCPIATTGIVLFGLLNCSIHCFVSFIRICEGNVQKSSIRLPKLQILDILPISLPVLPEGPEYDPVHPGAMPESLLPIPSVRERK